MASRGTYSSRAFKAPDKDNEKSKIPLGVSRRSSITSTSSSASKLPTAGPSWFSRGRRKQATAQPLAPAAEILSTKPKTSTTLVKTMSSQSEPLGHVEPAPSSTATLDINNSKRSSSTYSLVSEPRQRNVLRRKPSSVDQHSRYARTESSLISEESNQRRLEKDAISASDMPAGLYANSVFGVPLPSVSSSHLSYLPTRGADQATSSSRMANYSISREPKTPIPQSLPPPALSFAHSSGSSTRRSESPGSFSRTSTPTSISSYSPGIPAVTKSPHRARQLSPTRSRPPVVRRQVAIPNQELNSPDTQGLASVQESLASSSSSSTTRATDYLGGMSLMQSGRTASPSSDLPPQVKLQEGQMTMFTSRTKTEPNLEKPQRQSRMGATLPSLHTNFYTTSQQLLSKTPPPRPSREGTPRLEDVNGPSPVIRSNLSRLETTGHKRKESLERHRPLPESIASTVSGGKPFLGRSPSSTSSKSTKRSCLPSPNPDAAAPFGTWPTDPARSKSMLRPEPRERGVRLGRDLSPISAGPSKYSSRFGLFSKRTRSPQEATISETADKMAKKGPAAGTGHEGYGRYARRGRSGSASTSASRGRSTSSSGTSSNLARTSSGRHPSFRSREEPEIDDFLRERLSPVIISGGRVSGDRHSDIGLYLTTSGTSSASIISSDNSSPQEPQISAQRLAREPLTSKSAGSSTFSSRRVSQTASRGHEAVKSTKNSNDIEEEFSPRAPTLAARRSLHRSQLFDSAGPVKIPAPINTRAVASSPSINSRDTTKSSNLRTGDSLLLANEVSEGREGKWLKPKKPEKADKPTKSPSKWNFFQRANAANKKPLSRRPSFDQERPREVPVAVTRLPEARSVAHYAVLDNNDGEDDFDDTGGLIPSLKDLVGPQNPFKAPRSIAHHQEKAMREHKQSLLLPSPPKMAGEFTNIQGPPSPKVLVRQQEILASAPTEPRKSKEPRLQQVGRIPKVISKHDRQHKPPPQSFSRPFARTPPISQRPELSMPSEESFQSYDRPTLEIQTEKIRSDPWGEPNPADPVSAPARPQALSTLPDKDKFLAFPNRYGSEVSGSSSSGISNYIAIGIDSKRPIDAPHEDDVWNEYDDFLDAVESPALLPSNSVSKARDHSTSPKRRTTPAPLQIRKGSSISSSIDNPATEFPPMNLASSYGLPSPPLMSNLLSPNIASSPLSFSEFIAGYGDRNRASAASKVRSSISGSRYSQASFQSMFSEGEQKRHTQIMAEKTRNSSEYQSNLRFSALMTSRWLSFGRVLFSPAHDEIQSTKQDKVLVLDGLGNDDWSFYCALTYPDATIYNLSSFQRMNSASSRKRENGAVQSPQNHRQIFHAGMSSPFPFPKGYFSAAVFRFPSAATEKGYFNAVSECKRVLRPGGYLEMSIMDLDMINMGNRARRAVRTLKFRMQVAESDVSLKPVSDNIQKMLGRRGFENLSRCMVTVPVAGLISDSRAGSFDSKDVSFGDMLKDFTPRGDESITKMVSRVGRWWYTRCYESGVVPDGDPEQSIWADKALLKECEKRETGLKLLICYAQKPLAPKRRTISL